MKEEIQRALMIIGELLKGSIVVASVNQVEIELPRVTKKWAQRVQAYVQHCGFGGKEKVLREDFEMVIGHPGQYDVRGNTLSFGTLALGSVELGISDFVPSLFSNFAI
tara:strand:+ start:255 stop:578 length:324 start_codon:yes stop_codon:yes gene_type:complete